MKKPNNYLSVIVFVMLLSVFNTALAQQRGTNSSEPQSSSPGTFTPQKVPVTPPKTIPQNPPKLTEEQLVEEKIMDLRRNHPDLYYQYMKETDPGALSPAINNTGTVSPATLHVISAQEYQNMPAAKKAHIDQNPQLYIIQ